MIGISKSIFIYIFLFIQLVLFFLLILFILCQRQCLTVGSITNQHITTMINILQIVCKDHQNAPARIKLIDQFMVYLLICGIAQFAFCIVVGNYPFNAFLAGFGTVVAQFVLLANLRQQINPANAKEFKQISPTRAFSDFVFGSLVLHFLGYHFVN